MKGWLTWTVVLYLARLSLSILPIHWTISAAILRTRVCACAPASHEACPTSLIARSPCCPLCIITIHWNRHKGKSAISRSYNDLNEPFHCTFTGMLLFNMRQFQHFISCFKLWKNQEKFRKSTSRQFVAIFYSPYTISYQSPKVYTLMQHFPWLRATLLFDSLLRTCLIS